MLRNDNKCHKRFILCTWNYSAEKANKSISDSFLWHLLWSHKIHAIKKWPSFYGSGDLVNAKLIKDTFAKIIVIRIVLLRVAGVVLGRCVMRLSVTVGRQMSRCIKDGRCAGLQVKRTMSSQLVSLRSLTLRSVYVCPLLQTFILLWAVTHKNSKIDRPEALV